MNRISSLDVLRVHIAESGLYAYVQMRSADDAERIMLTLNKIPLLIDGCAGNIFVVSNFFAVIHELYGILFHFLFFNIIFGIVRNENRKRCKFQ